MQQVPPRELDLDPQDWPAFRALAHRMLDHALDHVQGVRERPVWQPVPEVVKSALKAEVPQSAQGLEQVCDDFMQQVFPYAAGNTHPRFWGWVNGSGTAGGVVAEMLAATMNSNAGGRDHGAPYVEQQVLQWCKTLYGFPQSASGLVVSGTSMATVIALASARYRVLGRQVRTQGLQQGGERLVGYTSVEGHACIAGAFDLIGLGSDALRKIPVDEHYRLDMRALAQAVARDRAAGLQPFVVVGAAATVNTGAVDPLAEMADYCEREGLWFHVDGAFGAVAALSERHAPLYRGLDRADSLAFDFHKWMHVPYEAGCVLIRDAEAHLGAFRSRPEYLAESPRGLAGGEFWACDYGPELSRGFRALKVWFTLKEHGVEGIARKAADNCAQARALEAMVRGQPRLQMMAPVGLNIVCFRFRSDEPGFVDALNEEIVMQLQEEGVAAPSTTTLGGQVAIRVNITNHRSRLADFELLVREVLNRGERLSQDARFRGEPRYRLSS